MGKHKHKLVFTKKLAIAVTAVAVLLLPAANLLAAGPITRGSGGNGLRVSPVRTDAVIQPGKNQTVTVNVTNVTSATSTLKAIINDFTASPDESGNPAIILNPDQYAASHSLKRYISPISSFTLAPGEQRAVPVEIKIPANAAGGGYFGAVRFAPLSTPNGPNQNVSLAGSVGSLILVKVPGDLKELVLIKSFDVRRDNRASSIFTSGKNLNATVRFENRGNVQEAPFGKILIKNRSGKTLSTYEVNSAFPPGNVLPDSVRKFNVPLKEIKSFGQYKMEGNFGYGTGGQLLSAKTTFYVIPAWMIWVATTIIVLVLFAIFILPRLIRAYNQRVLRNARRK